jgi:hypothetical protein
MAEPSKVAKVAVPSYKTWHARTHGDVTTERVRSWQHRLTAEEIALTEAALGDRLKACGYELSGAPRPAAAVRLRYEWATLHHRLAPAGRAVADLKLKLRPEPPVAARLTTRQGGTAPDAVSFVPAPSSPANHAETRAHRSGVGPVAPPAPAQPSAEDRTDAGAQPPTPA